MTKKEGVSVTCGECGYEWSYRGIRTRTTCPKCRFKTVTGCGEPPHRFVQITILEDLKSLLTSLKIQPEETIPGVIRRLAVEAKEKKNG